MTHRELYYCPRSSGAYAMSIMDLGDGHWTAAIAMNSHGTLHIRLAIGRYAAVAQLVEDTAITIRRFTRMPEVWAFVDADQRSHRWDPQDALSADLSGPLYAFDSELEEAMARWRADPWAFLVAEAL